MGNKPSRDDNSTPDSVPISLISTAEGSFGLDGTWKPNAILAVLETLFRVPCLGECILGAQIDQKCRAVDHLAIYELQLLFDARANAAKGLIVSTDQFLKALIETQLPTNGDAVDTKIFDENDPSHIYCAISDLIVSSLPELRGIFYDRNDTKLLLKKEIPTKAIKTNGICISLVPYFEVSVGNEIISLKLPRPKILENTPIFVVTTSYPLVTTMGQRARYPISCYSLAFPTSLNLMKLTPPTTDSDRMDLIYELHSVVAEVQGTNGTRNIKSFYRTGPDINAWCESATKPIPRSLNDLQALGAPRSNTCVRVLIYIQTDLSFMTSSHLPIAGMKIFKEASSNAKLNAAGGIPFLQQMISLGGSHPPLSPAATSPLSPCVIPKGTGSQPRGSAKLLSNAANPLTAAAAAAVVTMTSSSDSIGVQPMEEEQEEEDEEDEEEDEEEDDDYDYESDGDEDEYDSTFETPDYEDEAPAECQCPTCRRERDQKLRELARLRSEKDLLEQMKREKLRRLMTPKTPGTGSVPYQPTIVKDAERVTIDGKSMVRDIVLHSITAMEGYSCKSNEELRFEDYYLDSPTLFAIKKVLENEVCDRAKEARTTSMMEKEEKMMRVWCLAADRAWTKYTAALVLFKDGLLEQASELFTQALRICYAGSHSASCYYYRALCGYPKNSSLSPIDGTSKECLNVCADLVLCISMETNNAEAHYLLGSLLTRVEPPDWERAETHLEASFKVNPCTFEGDTGAGRMAELVRCREGAAHTRLVSAAETKKTLGNAALARGAYTEAERMYTAAILICPDSEKSHIYYCNRAAARCEIGMRLDPSPEVAVDTMMTAISDCDKSVELQPGYAKAVFRRLFCFGVVAFLQNDLECSLKHFSAALELDPTNALVKQEMRKVTTAIDVIKAKERVIEIEREVAAREALRAAEKEKEKKSLEEKKAREEMIRRVKAEKLEQERVERAKVKAERELLKSEKGKMLAEEEEKEKEEKKMEKEKQRLAREQEKAEEREKKRIEREREKQKAKEDKDKKDKEIMEAEEKERAKKREFAIEMNRVKSVIVASAPTTSFTPISITLANPHPSTPAVNVTKELPIPQGIVSPGKPKATAATETSTFKLDFPLPSFSSATSVSSASSTPKGFKAKVSQKTPATSEANVKTNTTPLADATPTPPPAPTPAPTPPPRKLSSSILTASMVTGMSSKHEKSTTPAPPPPVVAAVTLASASKALLAATAVSGTSITRIVECPQTRVGIVIGTKGSVIMEMMKKTSCKIVINQEFPDGVAREIIFTGTKEQIEAAKVLVHAVIVHGPIILSNVELLNQAAAAAIAISNPPASTSSGVLHARQTGTARVTQASAQLIRTNNIGVPGLMRMEPSGMLGDRENTLSLEEKERRVRKMMMTAPILTHQFDESDTLCVICAEPFREGERILAFGVCNHKGPCSICTVRMRAVGGDFSCALCRQDMGCVVCTTRDVPFKDFNLPGNPTSDLIYLPKGRIFIPKTYYHSAVAPLFEFRCRECKEVFVDGDLLRSHYESMHSLIQCVLCAHFKQAFPSEQAVYTLSEYDRHMREGSADGSDGQGHPECAFCQVRYYDKTELYKHVTKSHQTCHLCSRDGTQYKYYRDYKMLEEHFRKEHFACDEFECVEKRNVVFKSLFDLQAHKRSVHSQAATNIMNEGPIGGDWDFPSLQGSTAGQSQAQSLAASIRRSGPGQNQIQGLGLDPAGKAAESFSSPEAFPSLGSTRRSSSDLSNAAVSTAHTGSASSSAKTSHLSGPPLPLMTAVSNINQGSRYDDHSDTGFDYSSASLSLNATATPYAPANPPPPPMGLIPSVPMGEYQGDYGSRTVLQPSPHKTIFGDIPSLIGDTRLPARHQSPSIGDLTSMLSGITSQPHTERSNSFSLTNQFAQSGSSSLNINDYFSSGASQRSTLSDFGGGLGGAFSSSTFSGMIGSAREEQGPVYSLPYSDHSSFGAIGGSMRASTSRLPLSLLHDDEDDDEGVYGDDFQMKMLTEDDEDEKIEVSLGAYRAGHLSYDKVSELCTIACADYGLDAVCRAYFYDSPVEMQIAVLASLTSVPPGLRANDNAFVKTSFQNMVLHPSTRPAPTSNISNIQQVGLSLEGVSLKGHGFELDHHDVLFADISSLSSSLMVKDHSNDAADRPLLSRNSVHQLNSNSYDCLLFGSDPPPLLSPGVGDYSRTNGLSGGMELNNHNTTPLRMLKNPAPGTGVGVGMGIGSIGVSGVSGPLSVSSIDQTVSGSVDDSEEAATLLAAQQERAQFPPEFIDKLVAVLKKYGSDGLLGSQFPEAFKKLHGEKLVLENKKGRKLKLIHVLDGHPNVRKEKLGTYKWYYRETVTPIGSQAKLKVVTKTAVKAVKQQTKGAQLSPTVVPTSYIGSPGIEVDLLPADSFPCVAWLREEDMHMYRWAGNAKEWTEYAMRLRPDIAVSLEGSGGEFLAKLRRQSGCAVSIGSDMLNGKTEKFLVFVRGDSGQPSNGAMTLALEIFSLQLRSEIFSQLDSPYVDEEEEMRQMGMPLEGRMQKELEIPAGAVSMITGKNGKLHAMRKKSGAYIALICKARGQARLTISGTAAAVESALAIGKQALAEYEAELSA